MGMDVFGKSPSTEEGKCFYNNCWWWRPLADYCCEIAPDITAKCKYWHSNDGGGLGAEASIKLADALQAELDAERTRKYAQIYTSQQEMMPNEPCRVCESTGRRKPIPELGAGDLKTGIKCNGCDGSGIVRPHESYYPFAVKNVQEFVMFLRGCGGFEIW